MKWGIGGGISSPLRDQHLVSCMKIGHGVTGGDACPQIVGSDRFMIHIIPFILHGFYWQYETQYTWWWVLTCLSHIYEICFPCVASQFPARNYFYHLICILKVLWDYLYGTNWCTLVCVYPITVWLPPLLLVYLQYWCLHHLPDFVLIANTTAFMQHRFVSYVL